MRRTICAYLIALVFLIAGGTAAWFILWPITCNDSILRVTLGPPDYEAWTFALSMALGSASGTLFALVNNKRQFRRALIFCAITLCIALVALGYKKYLWSNDDALYSFLERGRHAYWLQASVYWGTFWISHSLHYWLFPQLGSLLVAAAVTQKIRARIHR